MKTISLCLWLLGCGVILRGQSESLGLDSARQTMNAQKSQNPTDDLDRMVDSKGLRLKNQTKNIRFKMLVRNKNDPTISPEYDWSTKPKLKGFAPQVVYPYALLAENLAGQTTVRFRINQQGRVDLSTVLEAARPEFGLAAQAAVETMVFTAAKKKDGSPAMVLCDADFKFVPNGSGDVLVTMASRQLLQAIKSGAATVANPAELDTPLRPVTTPSPVYPSTLVREGKTGTAEVEFMVDAEGWVELPRVVSATAPEFGHAAVQAIATWQYTPPLKQGRPVLTRARLTLEFTPAAGPPK